MTQTQIRGWVLSWALTLVLAGMFAPSARAHPNSFDSNIDLNIRITETALIFDLDMATFLFPPLEDVKFGLVAPKPTAAERAAEMEAYIAEKCSVHVDGVLVKPKLTELVYDENPQGLHLGQPTPIIYALMSYSYPLKTKPREIRMRWGIYLDIPDSFYETLTEPELFGEDLSELNPQLDAYGEWQVAYFAPIEPEFIWHSPDHRVAPPPGLNVSALTPSEGGRTLPGISLGIGVALFVFLVIAFARRLTVTVVAPVVLVGSAGAFLARGLLPVQVDALLADSAIEMPDAAGAVEIFKTLHGNIYRAFDYEEESDVYQTLAQSVDGDLLETVYNEVFQNLIMRDQGGAVAKVSKVDVLECIAKPNKADGADPDSFEVDCHWRVHAMVTHNGHTHRRINEYRAYYDMAPRNGKWKITGSRVADQKRVFTRDLQKELTGGGDVKPTLDSATVGSTPTGDKDPERMGAREAEVLGKLRLAEVFLALNEQNTKVREAGLLPLVEDSLLTMVVNELLERIRAEEEDERDCVFLSDGPPIYEAIRAYEVTREAETRFQLVCRWRIAGSVEVEGETRDALHAFSANFEMAYRDGRWKITDLQIDSHERLDPSAATPAPPPTVPLPADARVDDDDQRQPADPDPRP